MKRSINFILAAAPILACFQAQAASVEEEYGPFTGSKTLDQEAGYTVSWNVTDDHITLLLTAQTTGWLGFGIAEDTSGSMLGADVVTYSTVGGEPRVLDQHVGWSAYPISPYPELDDCQDWELLTSETNATLTQVVLRRALVPDDQLDDRPIESGSTRIIYAYGADDEETVNYHGSKRGASSIDFFRGNEQFETYKSGDEEWLISPLPDETSHATFVMSDYEVPDAVNTYACQYFNVSEHASKGSIAIEPVISPDTADLVHHMLLHICEDIPRSDPHECPRGLLGTPKCATLTYGWAVGGGPLILPEDTSFTGQMVYGLEIHYNNPTQEIGRSDSSGVRVHYSTDPRSRFASIISVGDTIVAETAVIPAGESEKHFNYGCPSSCTNRMTNPSVEVFGSFLHMHAYGKQIWSAHYGSDETLKGVTNKIDFWSFEFQQITPVSYTFQSGDSVRVHCTYDTTKTDSPVKFSSGSEDEMCMEFLIVSGEQPEALSLCGGLVQYAQDTPPGLLCRTGEEFTFHDDVIPGNLTYPQDVLFGTSSGLCTSEPTTTEPSSTVSPSTTEAPSGAASSSKLNLMIGFVLLVAGIGMI